ncbi:hypothetical protein QBC47DRAFT_317337 [Echria macrotheca]|uniref:DUF924-domain-containing protein n=1 Tax=Echria macrotheca TaxID=438768 RepID=A0AAJ0BH36_9PEZI|nr:hypothetical protein QBC47DRAFT_317337 [Echria macrotheca]
MERLRLAIQLRGLRVPRRSGIITILSPRLSTIPSRRCLSTRSHRQQVNNKPTVFKPTSHQRAKMTTNQSPSADILREAFNPAVFDKIRTLWFQNITDPTQLILPTPELAKQWFTSDANFDKLCVETFTPQLQTIITQTATINNLTGSSLIDALSPLTPLDYLSLLLLLDQVPRNCFRGSEAKKVFTIFDPIAIEVALRAISDKIPDAPEIKYRAAYRLWFYLPLQHSEDRKVHELSMTEHRRMFADMRELVDGPEPEPGTQGAELIRECREFLSGHRAEVDKWEGMMVSFAERHKVLIDRFGRYPHRNEAMGREATEEEARYLAEGGETFSSG